MAIASAISKADRGNAQKAQLARQEYQNALHLFPTTESGWKPKVLTCSSLEKEGIQDIWNMIMDFSNQHLQFIKKRRNDQSKYWMYETINETLKSNFYQNKQLKTSVTKFEKEVAEGKTSSFVAAQQLLDEYYQKNRG